jgi:hypothetical protein
MIVFGGYDGTFYGDVWSLSFQTDPATWSELSPSAVRRRRARDTSRSTTPTTIAWWCSAATTVVSAPALRRNDVWALSLDGDPAWSDITPAADGPSARSSAAAVYDSRRDAHDRSGRHGSELPR